ncbi:MAG: tRNA dihydrouridine synthase [Patescibacteria group bacterium]
MDNFWQKQNKPILALAPMAGVTDIAFRQMCKQYGADVIYTEFASADALIYESQKTFDMIRFAEEERPVVVQIFGNKPEHMGKAAAICEELGFDGIDINFGCPAYKVVKHGGGVSLMREPERCRELIQATIEAVKIPVSIKIRSSISRESNGTKKTKNSFVPDVSDPTDCGTETDLDSVTAIEFIEALNGLDIAAIMIHARSYERPFDGYPEVEIVQKLRKVYDGILIHNGGIYTPEVAKELLEKTGADGLGIARGAWGQPWLFQQIKEYLETGEYWQPSHDEIIPIILEHARRAFDQKGERGVIELRKHLSWYIKGWPEAKKMRNKLMQTKSYEEVENILKY